MLERTYLALIATVLAFQDRLKETTRKEDGFTTLEWVIIAAGVFVLAGIAVGVVVAAVNGKLSQIN
jgi:hypothetical protein